MLLWFRATFFGEVASDRRSGETDLGLGFRGQPYLEVSVLGITVLEILVLGSLVSTLGCALTNNFFSNFIKIRQ